MGGRATLVNACAHALGRLAPACQQAIAQTAAPPVLSDATLSASGAWDAFVSEVLESYFGAQPNLAVWAGRHEFDGKLPDWSARGIRREIQRLHAQSDRARRFKDNSLDQRQRFERDYLVATIDDALFWLESVVWPFRSPAFYGFVLDNTVYDAREYASCASQMATYTK